MKDLVYSVFVAGAPYREFIGTVMRKSVACREGFCEAVDSINERVLFHPPWRTRNGGKNPPRVPDTAYRDRAVGCAKLY